MSLPKLAVLDDWANIAPKHLDVFSDKIEIAYFPETLNPEDPADLDELVTRLRPFELISTMRERTPFRKALVERLPNLKVLFTTGPRNGGIDVAACADRGIPVVGTSGKPAGATTTTTADSGNKPSFDTTNEQTWALILGLAKNIADNDRRVKTDPKAWQSDSLALPLAGKKLALLGLGRLGLQCAATGKLGFGMEVIAWSPNLTQAKADEAVATESGRGLRKGSITVVSSKEELFRQADVLSVHVVLGERSRNAIGRAELTAMKRSAILVNTSRGPIVNEEELLDVLRNGQHLRGYGADVFNTEPLPPHSEWRSLDWGQHGRSHVVLSPHMGYVTEFVLDRMYQQTADNVRDWLDGNDFVTLLKP